MIERAARSTVLTLDAGLDSGCAGGLGALEHLVQLCELLGRADVSDRRDPHRARDVRAIPGHRSADVDDDRLAGLDHALAGLVMRRRRVRATGDDPERCHVVALVDESLAHLACDVRLRPADEPAVSDRLDDTVRGVRGLAQQRDLCLRP